MNPAQLSMPVDEIGKLCKAVYKPGYRNDVTDEELISEAVSAAGAADSVVVFVGTTDQIEGEGYDRADTGLPAAHLQLLRAVAEVNRRVVVVNMSGSAVDLRPILEESRAVLHAWLPGQAGGAAIARVLFGLADPSGRLSETFPVELEHNPSYLSFPGTIDRVDYSGGVFVGYRHYDTRKLPVSFPFGYGLSYTSFVYEDLRVQQLGSDGSPSFCVTVDIRNAGDRPGAEVVQLYIRDVASFEPRPTRELKAFAKVALEPDESEIVTLELDGRAFSWYVEHLGRFAVESGEFEIEVGSSSRDIRLSHTVSVVSADTVRPRLTEQHDLREFLAEGDPGDHMHRAYEKVAESSGRGPLLRLFEGSPVNKVLVVLPLFGASEESVDELKKAVYDAMGKPAPE
jgi:beta-glucosidase